MKVVITEKDVEKLDSLFAENFNGGKWTSEEWYRNEHRQIWILAVEKSLKEIEKEKVQND